MQFLSCSSSSDSVLTAESSLHVEAGDAISLFTNV